MSNRTVSIIVAVLNEENTLSNLLDSICKQTWTDIELIIMDGGSKDGTVALIQSRENEVDYWCSQPDSGLYQAWNRALEHATGEYLCFLGADDEWISEISLRDLMSLTTELPDNVCSRSRMDWESSSGFLEAGSPWSWASLRETMNLSHHGLLHKRELFEEHGEFDESFQIAGDYEFLLRCGSSIQALFLDQVTVSAGASGISIVRPFVSLRERYRAQRIHHSISRYRSIMLFFREYGGIQIGRGKSGVKKMLGF